MGNPPSDEPFLPAALDWAAPALRWLFWPFRPKPRNIVAWFLASGLAASYLLFSWRMDGWVSCDFAGAWLTGRMFVENRAHGLYLVVEERPVLDHGYSGKAREDLEWQVLGKGHPDLSKVVVEGPLYPPTAGLLYCPLANLPPQPAHAVAALLYVELAFLVGWLLRFITHGRLKAGEASLLVMLFPNFPVSVVLGQNSIITLTIITASWALLTRARDRGATYCEYLAGLVWALLAYKPVFAVSLILVPIVLWRWRMLIGIVVGTLLFVGVTLPCLLPPEERYLWEWNKTTQHWDWALDRARINAALDPWWRWMEVGNHAADMYTNDRNWVWMSRDLASLPRRAMWDGEHFRAHMRYVLGIDRNWNIDLHQDVHAAKDLAPICLGLLAVAGLTTISVCVAAARRRQKRQIADEDASSFANLQTAIGNRQYSLARDAFVHLGAIFTTYHFMHYDLLLCALPVALLIENAAQRGWWRWSPRFEFALGVTLLFCLVLLSCFWQAARFLVVRHPPPAAISANDSVGTTDRATDSQSAAGERKSAPQVAVPLEQANHARDRSAPRSDDQHAGAERGHDASGATVGSVTKAASAAALEQTAREYTVPLFVLGVYLALVGIVLVTFLTAWGCAAWLQSWMFDAVLWTLLLFSSVDLAIWGPSTRLPFELLILLVAWVWAGSLTWRASIGNNHQQSCLLPDA